MKILVDTSVWSLALRKATNSDVDKNIVDHLVGLINDSRVVMIGQIRQELLSGISSPKTFMTLKEKLRAFDDLAINTESYELAAENFNTCRRKGIQGSHVDFLICAVAELHKLAIFTLDNDFLHYSKHIDIELYKA